MAALRKLRIKAAAVLLATCLIAVPQSAWPWLLQKGTITDPYFSSVVLLLHLDGTNGSTTYTDSSASNHTMSNSGSSALTTANFKFGSASIDIPSSTSGPVSNDSTDWDFGSGEFTIEVWIRRTSSISGVKSIISQWGSTSNFAWNLAFNGSSLAFFYSTTGTNNPSVNATYTATLNDFDYIAVDRDTSHDIRVYTAASGGSCTVLAGPTNVSSAFNNSTQTLRVGNDGTNSRGFPGQIDEIRITKGVARFAGTCVTPTAAFPNQ